MPAPRILIVEDEVALATGLRFNFEAEGCRAEIAGDGPTALDLFREADPPFDAVILDLMLPSMSGYEICREIRKLSGEVAILVLSARQLSEDKTLAFDAGTDQYMTKPFALPELLARVRNLLDRRPRDVGGTGSLVRADPIDVVELGETRVDLQKFEVHRGDEKHRLTSVECQLLAYFVRNEGVVLSRARIMEDVWKEPGDLTTRSIDNFVMRLRKLIEPNPSKPQHLISVRGTGYQFFANPD